MPQLASFADSIQSRLPEPIVEALRSAPIADLDDGPAVGDLANQLARADQFQWNGVTGQAKSLALSGLWLAAGDLDRSHTISQSIDSAEGSFWHGIMHRREGDFGNAKYWFRRVGPHPVFAAISERTNGIYSDPFEFVDLCSRTRRSDEQAYDRARQAQWCEWQSLMDYCLA